MDPADSEAIRRALQVQGKRLGEQEAALQGMTHQIQELCTQLQPWLASQASAAAPVPPRATITPLSRPERFSGDSGNVKPFLAQWDLHFELQASAFPTDRSRIPFVISHMTGRAEAWATAKWSRNSETCRSWASFVCALTQVFQYAAPERQAASSLMTIRQGRCRVSDYAIEFRIRAAESRWNEEALHDAFYEGLSPQIRGHLVAMDLPPSLNSLIALALKVDQRLTVQRQMEGLREEERESHSPVVSASQPPVLSASPEAMQVEGLGSSAEERLRQRREGRCFYCRRLGHLIARCPTRPGHSDIRITTPVSVRYTATGSGGSLLHLTLGTDSRSCSVTAFIDSGLEANLINPRVVEELGAATFPTQRFRHAYAANGKFLCRVTHRTQTLRMSFPDAHSERISFHVFDARSSDIILGSPWLKEHNPHIDWTTGQIKTWGEDCLSRCFAVRRDRGIQVAPVRLTEPGTALDLTAVPSCYHDLREVFSESKAKSLPPHRSYDCAIELLPGTFPTRGKLFSLTRPEHQAMRDYIEDSLAAGLIRPSSSPAGAGFFLSRRRTPRCDPASTTED
ncbi:5'-AMP-activated protein kinase subunit gamma-3b isoform X1 [Syngnathoides biaculeatus]|uniref:5'-AMP-activated protein kinase subunit gamma-3b isoform X1 n=1 Tax=Syngnathoides biaculeatus TaxID=300417 RepID=UPI002ADDB703|nr:5'-AMP-activated protein kinase subunit gamma-3b isoform X1 [Syngnathoides biaculeatus]